VILSKLLLLGLLTILAWAGLVTAARSETCRASYYGFESGRVTANGERFRPSGMTAAHRALRFGTRLRVWAHGRGVIVRINDRGPARWTGRCLDLSQGAARALGMIDAGVSTVRIERLD
jgi:rare lipoprotein A